MLERNYRVAIDHLARADDSIMYGQTGFTPKALLRGIAYRHMGISDSARFMFESARIILEREVEKKPNDYRFHQALGLTYAELGMAELAIREIEWAVELFPLSRDAFFGTRLVESEANIYCMVGEFERAIERLDLLLSIPSDISVALLKIDPIWDPLRDHPRFQALLEKYEKEHGTR